MESKSSVRAKGYKDFIVWQKSMDLAAEVYRLMKFLPKDEVFGLVSQMKRAALSIPSNIAEGQGRNSGREFIKFLSIARGSQCELETQLQFCKKIDYLTEEEVATALGLCEEISKMLNSLIKKISLKINPT